MSEATLIDPSATIGADGAVTVGGATFPPPPVDAAPAVESAPVEAVPIPEPPAPVDPFAPVKLENGDLEIRLDSGETFRGKTPEEVIANLAKSKLEATRYIQELRNRPAETPAQQATPKPVEIDPSTMVLWDLLAPGAGLATGKELIDRLNQLQTGNQTIAAQAEDIQAQQTAVQFVTQAPDFVKTSRNIALFDQTLQDMNLQFNVKNSLFVHNALKGAGLYEAAPPRTETGQFAPRAAALPLPPGGNAPSTTGAGTPTVADLYKMSTAELEKIMNGNRA